MFNRMTMKCALAAGASLAALVAAAPATAQDAAADAPMEEIVVTAQRQAESLQDVPVAVSAFTGESLRSQQIENTLDLQQSLPNITFTKTNFTSSNFSIRGIGDGSQRNFAVVTAVAVDVNHSRRCAGSVRSRDADAHAVHEGRFDRPPPETTVGPTEREADR